MNGRSLSIRATRRIVLLVALGLVSVAAQAEVVVVVAANSPIRTVSDSEVADIFLGKLARLSDGTRVAALDQAEGTAAREAFYLKFTGKSPAQVKAFWSKVIFTGRGRPPRAVATDAAVVRALREDPAAIGYIDRSSVDSTTRIVR